MRTPLQLYTWGSGYKGQLGHGKKPVVTDKPVLVDFFTRRSLSIAFVTCSSYHNAVLTDAEEVRKALVEARFACSVVRGLTNSW